MRHENLVIDRLQKWPRSVVSALVRLRLKNLEFKYVSQSWLYSETVWREGEATGHLQRVPPEGSLEVGIELRQAT